MKKTEQRTITRIYELDPEKSSRLVSAVCAGTMRSASCVYFWMSQKRRPCFLEAKFIKEKVAEIYGLDIPITELFPPTTKKKCQTIRNI